MKTRIYHLIVASLLLATPIFSQDNLINTIVKDSKVNSEKNGLYNDIKHSPLIYSNENGNILVLWMQVINQNEPSYINMQYYSSYGAPVGSNIKVNEIDENCDQVKGIINSDGSSFVFWKGEKSQIFVQRFDKNAIKIGNNKLLQDYEGSYKLENFSISSDGDGNFIIIASCSQHSTVMISNFIQKYNFNLEVIGNRSNLLAKNHMNSDVIVPKISLLENGNYLIAWIEVSNYSHGNINENLINIYSKYLDKNDNVIIEKLQINDFNLTSAKNLEIYKNHFNNFTIKWNTSNSENLHNTYFQLLSTYGKKINKNINVEVEKVVLSPFYKSTIAYAEDGSFIVFWANINDKYTIENSPDIKNTIFGQRYSSNGNKLGYNFKVPINSNTLVNLSNVFEYTYLGLNSIAIVWIVTKYNQVNWSQFLVGTSEILIQKFAIEDETVNPPQKVNSDSNYASQYAPALSINDNGKFKITWADNREKRIIAKWSEKENCDIFVQEFDTLGNSIGINYKINDDSSETDHAEPSIAQTYNGNSLVIWKDFRESKSQTSPRSKIYAQLISDDGKKIGYNFIVSVNSSNAKFPLIGSTDSKFIVVWVDTIPLLNTLNIQIYSDEGVILGENKIINDSKVLKIFDEPIIEFSKNGNFVICWKNYADYNKLLGQYFNSEGEKIGRNFVINDPTSDSQHYSVLNQNNNDENIVISWKDSENNIFAQIISKDGELLNKKFKINEYESNSFISKPEIARDIDGSFIIEWATTLTKFVGSSEKKYSNLFGQRYYSNGEKFGSKINLKTTYSSTIDDFDIKLKKGKILSTWREKDYYSIKDNIWFNIKEYGKIVTGVGDENIIKNELYLYQNYPNPFNPTTKISYQLPEKSIVTLKVYDILGKEIVELVNGSKDAGNHEATFDASNLSSGIYYYQIKAGNFIQSRKMLLIK